MPEWGHFETKRRAAVVLFAADAPKHAPDGLRDRRGHARDPR
ncbi:MAG: hypothetical protein QOH19_2874 [Actinomycetota bacterium]|jgi:hypothetical protein|nr:hypothetical protein [Actinomycetota bacterium]